MLLLLVAGVTTVMSYSIEDKLKNKENNDISIIEYGTSSQICTENIDEEALQNKSIEKSSKRGSKKNCRRNFRKSKKVYIDKHKPISNNHVKSKKHPKKFKYGRNVKGKTSIEISKKLIDPREEVSKLHSSDNFKCCKSALNQPIININKRRELTNHIPQKMVNLVSCNPNGKEETLSMEINEYRFKPLIKGVHLKQIGDYFVIVGEEKNKTNNSVFLDPLYKNRKFVTTAKVPCVQEQDNSEIAMYSYKMPLTINNMDKTNFKNTPAYPKTYLNKTIENKSPKIEEGQNISTIWTENDWNSDVFPFIDINQTTKGKLATSNVSLLSTVDNQIIDNLILNDNSAPLHFSSTETPMLSDFIIEKRFEVTTINFQDESNDNTKELNNNTDSDNYFYTNYGLTNNQQNYYPEQSNTTYNSEENYNNGNKNDFLSNNEIQTTLTYEIDYETTEVTLSYEEEKTDHYTSIPDTTSSEEKPRKASINNNLKDYDYLEKPSFSLSQYENENMAIPEDYISNPELSNLTTHACSAGGGHKNCPFCVKGLTATEVIISCPICHNKLELFISADNYRAFPSIKKRLIRQRNKHILYNPHLHTDLTENSARDVNLSLIKVQKHYDGGLKLNGSS